MKGLVWVLTYLNEKNVEQTSVFDSSKNAHIHAVGLGCDEYTLHPCVVNCKHYVEPHRLKQVLTDLEAVNWKGRPLASGATLYSLKSKPHKAKY
jgi:hypothetical protein